MHAHRLIHICSSEKKMMIEKDEKKRAVSEMFRLMVKKKWMIERANLSDICLFLERYIFSYIKLRVIYKKIIKH